MSAPNLQDQMRLAVAGLKEGQSELASQLKRMSIPEFANADPKLLESLTAEQRIEVLRAFVPADALPAPAGSDFTQNESEPSQATTIVVRSRIREVFEGLPRALQALVSGGLAAIVGAVGAVGGLWVYDFVTQAPTMPIPINATLWPPCKRLDRETDACLYTVSNGLSIDQAVARLGVDQAAFIQLNHLSSSALTRGQRLVIWRGLKTLSE
jgi:hypothetical protein